MPLRARDLREKIRSALRGKSDAEQIRVLRGFLDEWPSRNLRGEYADMRRQLQQRLQKLEVSQEVRASSRPQDDPFVIPKAGHLSAPLVGLPNSGKSLLFQRLGGKGAMVAEYPFSTTTPASSLVALDNLRIQLIDLPPIVERALESLPYAAKVASLLGKADVICGVIDLSQDPDSQEDALEAELASLDVDCDRTPVVWVGTRSAAEGSADWECSANGPKRRRLAVSSEADCADVLTQLSRAGGYKAVYTKPPGQPPEEADRLWVDVGATVKDVAGAVHRDLARRVTGARVWGGSVASPGQLVVNEHVLADGDVAELRLR